MWGSGSVFRTQLGTREATLTSDACVLYTSRRHGSDEPVVFEHRQMVRLATSGGPCALTGDDRVAQLASNSSGTGNFGIWRSLAAGAEIVVYRFQVTDGHTTVVRCSWVAPCGYHYPSTTTQPSRLAFGSQGLLGQKPTARWRRTRFYQCGQTV